MARLAKMGDIKRPPPHLVTSKYLAEDGEALQFGIRKLSVGTFRRIQAEAQDDFHRAQLMARASIVEPKVSAEEWEILEEEKAAYTDLLQQIADFNGIGEAAQRSAGRTFRDGDAVPG